MFPWPADCTLCTVMAKTRARWEVRAHRLVRSTQWLTLLFAVFISFVDQGDMVPVALAAVGATAYVLTTSALPVRFLIRPIIRELMAVLGAVATLAAVSLTGGPESPYLILSLTPALFAGVLGGLRVGLATSALSAGLLVAIAIAGTEPVPLNTVVPWAALYFVVAIAFNQARRILIDQQQQADELWAETLATSERLHRLENAHSLLTQLARVADPAELSPIAMGRTALDAVAEALPVEASVAAIIGEDGPVVVAKRGAEAAELSTTTVPLEVGERPVGMVVLASPVALTDSELEAARDLLRPLAMGFSNILLLQDLTRTAIREERVRLARELHDEIGPSLASLGLSLDVALLETAADQDLSTHLQELRSEVGSLVDEVRATVADLRVTETASLTEVATRIAADLRQAVAVALRLEEVRPPRPSIRAQVVAILSEAVRNATRHGQPSKVMIEGRVDFDRGRLRIEDDGPGFDPDRVPEGHYGLIGMRERAAAIGGSLDVASGPTGTTITLTWGES